MRDVRNAAKLARGLPKFGEVLQAKKGVVPTLCGEPRYLELFWDLTPEQKERQIFVIRGTVDGKDFECKIAKQALEHYLRAI